MHAATMSSIEDRFAYAVEKTKTSKGMSKAAEKGTSTKEKLMLYAFYKQVCPLPCPPHLP